MHRFPLTKAEKGIISHSQKAEAKPRQSSDLPVQLRFGKPIALETTVVSCFFIRCLYDFCDTSITNDLFSTFLLFRKTCSFTIYYTPTNFMHLPFGSVKKKNKSGIVLGASTKGLHTPLAFDLDKQTTTTQTHSRNAVSTAGSFLSQVK